jgi:GNAT superfamily N-acetyltransferase
MLAVETHLNQQVQTEYAFRQARPDDAREIVDSYESVFGKKGVRAPGHEPYPAPEVFSEDGILAIIHDPDRDLIVAEWNGEIVGGMIITHNGPFHREFGCVSVRKKFQGKGISSRMLSHQKEMEKQSALAINTTEIVTHSMLSQSAHHHAGYNKITGFGYCQYPRVFFEHAPESCLWITSLEGKIIEWLRASRPTSQKTWQREDANAPTIKLQELNNHERELVTVLERPRKCYVPARYSKLASKLLAQFDDTLSFRIFDENYEGLTHEEQSSIRVDLCGDNPYAYFHFEAVTLTAPGFDAAWRAITETGKRYVQARLPMNSPSTLRNINLLRQNGFVFLGVAPLLSLKNQSPEFDDVFMMQWVDPDIVKCCPLPGATESVVKLYGHPINLTGELIAAIQRDLREISN